MASFLFAGFWKAKRIPHGSVGMVQVLSRTETPFSSPTRFARPEVLELVC
jgi:hypothetical protein